MADISKWLEMLVGPQLAGMVGHNIGAPAAPGVPAAPPPDLSSKLPGPMGDVNPNVLAPPMTGDPASDPLPGLGGPPMPPSDISPDLLNAPPIQGTGQPLNAAMGIDAPDPTRVENTGSLMPTDVAPPVADIPNIAPPAPPAIAKPIAQRKAAAAPRAAPLPPVAVTARSARPRTGPMGVPLNPGIAAMVPKPLPPIPKGMMWDQRLSPRKR